MSKRKIKVKLSPAGIDKAIRELEQYKKWLESCTKKFINELANEGMQIASAKFSNVTYDGTNDFSVSIEEKEGNAVAVVARGGTVLFVEFGTGVTYPDNHPEQPFVRGTYGKGHGSQRTWAYYGEPGSNGEFLRSTDKGDLYKTHGNPANMPMYNTVKELKDKIEEIARRCYV